MRTARWTRLVALGALLTAAGWIPAGCGDNEGVGGAGGGDQPFQLSASVEIVRDVEGVVHIYAKTNEDAFFASGYAQASDRLFQMEVTKRRFDGRQAELLGESKLADDRLIRQLDIATWGRENERAARTQTPGIHRLISAWTAGVNQRVEEVRAGTAPLPTGYQLLGELPEPWEIADGFVVAKGILFGNANQLEFDLLASLIDKYNPEVFAAVPFYAPLYSAFILPGTSGVPRVQGAAPPKPEDAARHSQRAPLPPDAKDKLLDFSRRLESLRPGASNNWALAPEHSNTGTSLIAGDPHQALKSPSLMWLSHLVSEEGADVVGFSFVGTPGVSIGHNSRLAWTATTTYPDVTDIWDVATDGDDVVLIGDQPVPITRREETILVRGAAPVPVVVEVVGDYGVLLPSDIVPLPLVDSGHRLLFGWTGYQATFDADAFFGIARSESLDEFEQSVDRMALGSFNFIGATSEGIAYRSSPLVPDRGDPNVHPPAYRLLPGNDASSYWQSYLPLEKMPASRAELSGILSSANNDPFGFTADGDLQNDPYYFGAYYDPGTRAARVRQRLDEMVGDGKVGLAEMQELQSDTYSLLAAELVPMARAALLQTRFDRDLAVYAADPRLARIVALLENWDLKMERSQAAPVAFESLVHFFARQVVADDLGVFFEPVLDSSPTYIMKFAFLAARDPNQTLVQAGRSSVVLQALVLTADDLETRFGSVDTGFTWADAHETHFGSESLPEFDGGSFATDGAEGTVNVSEGRFFDGAIPRSKHVSRGGAIYRMTATFDDDGTPRAFINLPRGNSGEPNSAFYDNRTADWLEDRYTLLRFKKADVDAGRESTVVLTP